MCTHATNANLKPFSGLLKCLFTVCIVVFLWTCFLSALRFYLSMCVFFVNFLLLASHFDQIMCGKKMHANRLVTLLSILYSHSHHPPQSYANNIINKMNALSILLWLNKLEKFYSCLWSFCCALSEKNACVTFFGFVFFIWCC